MTTEITARDKLLLYVVGMLAFIFFFVQFMLTPALEASDEAAADLAEAQQAQIAMQETIALADTNAAAKTGTQTESVIINIHARLLAKGFHNRFAAVITALKIVACCHAHFFTKFTHAFLLLA